MYLHALQNALATLARQKVELEEAVRATAKATEEKLESLAALARRGEGEALAVEESARRSLQVPRPPPTHSPRFTQSDHGRWQPEPPPCQTCVIVVSKQSVSGMSKKAVSVLCRQRLR